jgi:lipopolysaccharide/colanic/teichoic acid biosynthesis glycosyltransferase
MPKASKLLDVANLQYSGFYYIGKSSAHIEKLVAVCKRGYASEALDNAKTELLRNLKQDTVVLPEVILCEARFDLAAIQAFSQFLRQHPILHSIPFIVDGSGLSGDELLFYKKNARPDEILFLQNCDDNSLRLKIQFLLKIKAGSLNTPAPQIEERLQRELKIGLFFKRAFDILIAVIALLVLSPLFLLIALAIRIETRGSIFYISKRAGKGYKIFNFYKFRTMQVGADKKMSELTHLNQYSAGSQKGAVFFKISNDPRITRVGTFLRNTSLDELPQLLNVFLGDMSLVGNRPLPLYEAQTLTTDDYAARFMAPAGITGLWQIKKRGNKDMSVEERINIDIAYASSVNFATDFWIIANTPSALLQKENV